MDWSIVANLIINVGIPAAEKLIQKWENKAPVTVAEFQDIKVAASQTARDRMLKMLTAQGIDPTSPTGLALLNLT